MPQPKPRFQILNIAYLSPEQWQSIVKIMRDENYNQMQVRFNMSEGRTEIYFTNGKEYLNFWID